MQILMLKDLSKFVFESKSTYLQLHFSMKVKLSFVKDKIQPRYFLLLKQTIWKSFLKLISSVGYGFYQSGIIQKHSLSYPRLIQKIFLIHYLTKLSITISILNFLKITKILCMISNFTTLLTVFSNTSKMIKL